MFHIRRIQDATWIVRCRAKMHATWIVRCRAKIHAVTPAIWIGDGRTISAEAVIAIMRHGPITGWRIAATPDHIPALIIRTPTAGTRMPLARTTEGEGTTEKS